MNMNHWKRTNLTYDNLKNEYNLKNKDNEK